jgi:hypothetical protein
MRKQLKQSLTFALSALLVGTAACDQSPAAPAEHDHLTAHAGVESHAGDPTRAHGDLLKAVRQQTSRFNSTTQAARFGYAADEHCVEVPGLGGMGYHYVNEELVDPVFDPMQPEVMLYAPGPGGNLRLVGVEYIVIDVGQEHPMFGDHPFDVGGTPIPVPHWSLHVWVHEDNPNGVFVPFNPRVSCG